MKTKNVRTIEDLAEVLESMTENEKKQAFALLQGMVIGKELAVQQTERSA